VPVEVSFVLGESDPQTVTVPMSLDVRLQVGLSSALTPVITVGKVGPALVSVSELMAAGEPLKDNRGIVYEIDEEDTVEIIQLRADANSEKELNITGEVRNVFDSVLKNYEVELVLTAYDVEGRILAIASGYAKLDMKPGETSPFVIGTRIPIQDVGRYLIQVDEG
jgi:hypothetical protein